jgi:alpha-galactosidase
VNALARCYPKVEGAKSEYSPINRGIFYCTILIASSIFKARYVKDNLFCVQNASAKWFLALSLSIPANILQSEDIPSCNAPVSLEMRVNMAIIQSLETPEKERVWILETRYTAYVFSWSKVNRLDHVYWGAKLPFTSDYFPKELGFDPLGNWNFARSTHEEFPAWGDYKYNEPSLKARFSDGVREVLLDYVDSKIEENEATATLSIELQDPHYPLRVRLVYRVFRDHDLIERSAVLENTGGQPIEIEQIMSAAWHFPRRDSYQLTTLNGKWGGEFQIQRVDLPMGKQVVERRRGSTGFDSNPFFALSANGAATETHGEVWFGALAFSGNYKLVIERDAFEHVYVTGGINVFDFQWRLEGGEVFETPVFVGGFTNGGYGEASRRLHAYEIEYVVPRSTAHELRPIVYNSWYVTGFDVSYENQTKAAELAARLGVELFVMDDGWFGQRNNDRAGLGDWYVNREKFPEGLGRLIRKVNELGMEFGIWVEPEMVNPDSDLYRAHPDWVYHFPNRPRSTGRNQLVLNVSRPEVQEFILDFMNDLLGNNNIKFIKWDMNRHFSEPGWPDAPEGRDREIWVRHTRGVYDIFRQLRENHPHVLFESCSGGGGRVDLGIMPYAEQFWMTDNTDPYDDLFIQEGFTQAHAPLTRMMWVTDTNGINGRAYSLEYRFHLAMMGVLGLGADLTKWSEGDLNTAAGFIAAYKDIRETMQFGAFYRLRSPRESVLSAFQFNHPSGREAVVVVFLSNSQFGHYHNIIRLQGLDAEAKYMIEGSSEVWSGQALMNRGLPVALKGSFVSQLIRLSRA